MHWSEEESWLTYPTAITGLEDRGKQFPIQQVNSIVVCLLVTHALTFSSLSACFHAFLRPTDPDCPPAH